MYLLAILRPFSLLPGPLHPPHPPILQNAIPNHAPFFLLTSLRPPAPQRHVPPSANPCPRRPAAGRGRLPKVRYLLTALTDGSVAPPPLPLSLPSPEAPAGIESETRAGRIAGLPEGLGTQSGHACSHVQGAESSDDNGGRCQTTRRRTLMSFIELNIFVLNGFARRRGLRLLFDILGCSLTCTVLAEAFIQCARLPSGLSYCFR